MTSATLRITTDSVPDGVARGTVVEVVGGTVVIEGALQDTGAFFTRSAARGVERHDSLADARQRAAWDTALAGDRIESTERTAAEAVVAKYARMPGVKATELDRALEILKKYARLDGTASKMNEAFGTRDAALDANNQSLYKGYTIASDPRTGQCAVSRGGNHVAYADSVRDAQSVVDRMTVKRGAEGIDAKTPLRVGDRCVDIRTGRSGKMTKDLGDGTVQTDFTAWSFRKDLAKLDGDNSKAQDDNVSKKAELARNADGYQRQADEARARGEIDKADRYDKFATEFRKAYLALGRDEEPDAEDAGNSAESLRDQISFAKSALRQAISPAARNSAVTRLTALEKELRELQASGAAKDDWTPEARAAAAEARKKGTAGTKANHHHERAQHHAAQSAQHRQHAETHKASGNHERAKRHEMAAHSHHLASQGHGEAATQHARGRSHEAGTAAREAEGHHARAQRHESRIGGGGGGGSAGGSAGGGGGGERKGTSHNATVFASKPKRSLYHRLRYGGN